MGTLAKTDKVDAAMLAKMGSLLKLSPRPVPSPIHNDLKDLHLARAALVKDRTAAKNRAKAFSIPLLKRQNAERLKQIERQIHANIRRSPYKPTLAATHFNPDLKAKYEQFRVNGNPPKVAVTAVMRKLIAVG